MPPMRFASARRGVAAALLAASCGPGADSGESASTTANPTLPGTSTGAVPDATSTGSGEPPTTGPAAPTTGLTATSEAADSSGGIKLDLLAPDFGDRPMPTMPTCDNLAEFGLTSVGCEFWSVDTDTPLSQSGLGVGVGNPWDRPVTVTIEDRRGPGGVVRALGQVMLGPRESTIVELNGGPGGLLPGEDHVVAGGFNGQAAFRITADAPITAMQINPVGGASSFVPDASMLLPTSSLGTSHFALGYAGNGYVIVVATEDATTVTSSEGMVMLDAFDAQRFDAAEATGYFVGADKPVAVFSGSYCANVPGGQSWCDHLEEQLFPLAAWGTRYVGARHPQRVPDTHPEPEAVYWRVIAATDGTVVSFTPPAPGLGESVALDAGAYAEFSSAESFVAESDEAHPFMLVQYMAGGTSVGNCLGPADGTPVGDPYMVQMVPVEQWLTQLPFLTDTSYVRDFVWISRTAGTPVELACLGTIPDDHFVAIPGTDYEVGAVDLDLGGMGGEGDCVDGQQFITSAQPVGVSVGGIDCAASYAYPGGLSLDALWVPPDAPPG